MSRLFSSPSSKGGASHFAGDKGTSLMNEDISRLDNQWFMRWSQRLGSEGFACTKVATNGKPYERRVCVDARNLFVEIRGGRGGATGVMLDDLVDIWQGMRSPEFGKFVARLRGKDAYELEERAVVFQTPARTFSFLFVTGSARNTLAHLVVYLLKQQNRGVMARPSLRDGHVAGVVGSSEAPKEGHGKVTYENCSTYEGQFLQHMRHGTGALTLSEGTRYECEWRNDERHGRGKEQWADGTVFEGSYVRGMRCKYGVMTWPEGSKYSGQFESGRANGEGELVRTDGSVYKGHFAEDCMSGEGGMIWEDGVEYTGQFVANRRNGHGRIAWISGRWKNYDGQWKDGVQHGEGKLIDLNDQAYTGYFAQGKLERWEGC